MTANQMPTSSPRSSANPPRLILRFALYTALLLAAAACAILLFVRHYGTAQAERAVAFHARFVSDSILRTRLRASDLGAPVTAARRHELDRLFVRQVLVGGTLRAKIYGRDGRVTYSTDHALIGSRGSDRTRLARAFAGQTRTSVGSLHHADGGQKAKVLRSFAPVKLAGGRVGGALELDQDYAPIARAARKAFVPVAGVLELVLLALYLSLFPILRRVSQRMRRQIDAIEHQAFHDGLTGLPNRALFRDRLEQALATARRSEQAVAILLLDLDRFKEINDSLGHQSGDVLLQSVAKRLSGLLRDSDTLARLGGDEFCILSRDADAATATLLADRIREAMERPLEAAELQLSVEASVGIAVFPDHGEDVETLIRHADVALYQSKETHRPTVYAAAKDHYSPDRLALLNDLRHAIEEPELVNHYQPRVEIETGTVKSVEALVRWRHPTRGLLLPSEFVPLAEHTGLVRLVTRNVLDAALGHSRRLRDQGIELGVAVNLFGRDLLDLALPDEVADLLAKWRIEPDLLELEITENTILTDPTRARTILTRLSEQGVRLAIDDFGTGYSSLNYLKRLPVDVLKIDKSFVLNMVADDNDAMIVRSTIDLGHNLGLEVVAEGVETSDTLARLGDLGCDTAQGHYLGRPMTALALRRWLAERAPVASASLGPPRALRGASLAV